LGIGKRAKKGGFKKGLPLKLTGNNKLFRPPTVNSEKRMDPKVTQKIPFHREETQFGRIWLMVNGQTGTRQKGIRLNPPVERRSALKSNSLLRKA